MFEKSSTVCSLTLNIKKYVSDNKNSDDIKFAISDIIFQEEDDKFHDVCRSNSNDYAVYNYSSNIFENDIFLNDKYGNFFDWYLSDAISRFFAK